MDSNCETADRGIGWPMPRWALGFWLLFIAGSWWGTSVASLSSLAGSREVGALAVPLAVASRMVGFGVESVFYVVMWRSFGRRLRFLWLYTWIASLSLLDMIAEGLRGLAAPHEAPAPWLAPLVGPGVVDGLFASLPGLGVAVGSLGLLAATRIGVTALIQARELGVSAWKATTLTVSAWAVTRLSVWLTTDLLRGMSPLS